MNSRSSLGDTWVYFSIFLFSNVLLSYASLPDSIKLIIIFAGILIPFAMGCRNALRQKIPYSTALQSASAFKPSKGLILGFLALLLLTRFYHLTSLPFWPISDEGILSSLVLSLNKHWNGDLLQGEIRFEALFTWICYPFFKWMTPSLFTIRFIPGLFSLLTGLTAYWTAKKYFSTSWAFIFAWFCSLSFWAFSLSRFFMPTILIPLFELAALGSLAAFLSSKSSLQRWSFFLLTTLMVCLCFYTSIILDVIWPCVAFVLAAECFYQKRINKKFFFIFLILTALLDWPMFLARFSAEGLSHVQQTWIGLFPWKNDLTYINSLFWDGRASYPFGSDWGGLFNPLLTSLIFIGFIYILRIFDFYTLVCASVCFTFFLLPGFLSGSLEMYRITNSFIFFMAAAAWGIFSLIPSKTNYGLIVLFLTCTTGLDIYNFIYYYADIRIAPPGHQWRSVEYFNAYQILSNLNKQSGPIDVFTEWNTDYDNKTLDIACYPFNALDNPETFNPHVSWAAFTINSDYLPFLKNKFSPNLPTNDLHHSLGLFLIPISDISSSVLNQWIKTQKECEEIDFAVKNKNPKKPWAIYEKYFSDLASQQKNDRFLSSILWERAASFPLMDGNFPLTALDFQRAIQKGYPVPHLQKNLKLALFLSHYPAQSVQKAQ
jgi:hypothetical protein